MSVRVRADHLCAGPLCDAELGSDWWNQAQKGSTKPCAFTSSSPRRGRSFAHSPAIRLGATFRSSMDLGLPSVVRAEADPPHNFSRMMIERAIDGEGLQLWRLSAKAPAP